LRLDWAILANAAEVGPNNLSYVLGAGWDTSWRAEYPNIFIGSLLLRLMLNRTEVPRPHSFEIQILDEDGNQVAPPIQGNAQAILPVDYPKGWELPLTVAIGINGLPIPKAGFYSFEILVDGQHLRTVPFRFAVGAPQGQPMPPPALPPPAMP
jgi:hypothetical protein